MKIHFITEGASCLSSLVAALSPMHEVSENGSVSEISPSTEAVVIGEHVSPTHPQWQQAQALGLPIYSYGAFLYELHKMKTRVVIAGTQGRSEIAAMVLHTMDYFSKEIDYFLETPIGNIPTCKYSPEAEFVLIEGEDTLSPIEQVPMFQLYRPTLALISHIESGKEKQYTNFINTLTKGGYYYIMRKMRLSKHWLKAQKTNCALCLMRQPHTKKVEVLPILLPQREKCP